MHVRKCIFGLSSRLPGSTIVYSIQLYIYHISFATNMFNGVLYYGQNVYCTFEFDNKLLLLLLEKQITHRFNKESSR